MNPLTKYRKRIEKRLLEAREKRCVLEVKIAFLKGQVEAYTETLKDYQELLREQDYQG